MVRLYGVGTMKNIKGDILNQGYGRSIDMKDKFLTNKQWKENMVVYKEWKNFTE